eukprot:13436879-Alexandrium_andersonii.AAC.1
MFRARVTPARKAAKCAVVCARPACSVQRATLELAPERVARPIFYQGCQGLPGDLVEEAEGHKWARTALVAPQKCRG